VATNLHIDEQLLAEALRLSGEKTKRDTVNAALAEYVAKRKRKRILELFGKIDLDPRYNYKEQRGRK
jgi:Arc/MetJ family transcription regulator